MVNFNGAVDLSSLRNATPDDVRGFHNNSDVDSGDLAQHHTLGSKTYQAARGDHNHDKKYQPLSHPIISASLYKLQLLSSGSWYNIDFWSPDIVSPDITLTGGSENRTTWTLKKAGLYDIRFIAMFRNEVSSAGSRGSGIWINGGQKTVTLTAPVAAQVDYVSSATEMLYRAVVNDYVQFRVLQNTGADINVNLTWTRCSIRRVGD